MKLIAHDPRPWQICLYVILTIITITLCSILYMYADYVLQLAKSKQVPQIQITHADYVHITKSEVWMSGVTEQGEGWVK